MTATISRLRDQPVAAEMPRVWPCHPNVTRGTTRFARNVFGQQGNRMASIQEIAAALRSTATPGMKPKALRTAIREKFPDASKKEIVRAAFYALADASAADSNSELHTFALAERIAEENSDEVLRVSKRKKKKHRAAQPADAPPVH